MLTRSEIAAQIREWAKRIHCLDIVVYDEMRALAARLEAAPASPTLAELLKQIAAEHRTNGIYEEDGICGLSISSADEKRSWWIAASSYHSEIETEKEGFEDGK